MDRARGRPLGENILLRMLLAWFQNTEYPKSVSVKERSLL